MDPIEVIKETLQKRKLKQKALVGIIGDKCTVSKVIHKKRLLTVGMIRNVSKEFKIDANLLVQEYKLEDEK